MKPEQIAKHTCKEAPADDVNCKQCNDTGLIIVDAHTQIPCIYCLPVAAAIGERTVTPEQIAESFEESAGLNEPWSDFSEAEIKAGIREAIEPVLTALKERDELLWDAESALIHFNPRVGKADPDYCSWEGAGVCQKCQVRSRIAALRKVQEAAE